MIQLIRASPFSPFSLGSLVLFLTSLPPAPPWEGAGLCPVGWCCTLEAGALLLGLGGSPGLLPAPQAVGAAENPWGTPQGNGKVGMGLSVWGRGCPIPAAAPRGWDDAFGHAVGSESGV